MIMDPRPPTNPNHLMPPPNGAPSQGGPLDGVAGEGLLLHVPGMGYPLLAV